MKITLAIFWMGLGLSQALAAVESPRVLGPVEIVERTITIRYQDCLETLEPLEHTSEYWQCTGNLGAPLMEMANFEIPENTARFSDWHLELLPKSGGDWEIAYNHSQEISRREMIEALKHQFFAPRPESYDVPVADCDESACRFKLRVLQPQREGTPREGANFKDVVLGVAQEAERSFVPRVSLCNLHHRGNAFCDVPFSEWRGGLTHLSGENDFFKKTLPVKVDDLKYEVEFLASFTGYEASAIPTSGTGWDNPRLEALKMIAIDKAFSFLHAQPILIHGALPVQDGKPVYDWSDLQSPQTGAFTDRLTGAVLKIYETSFAGQDVLGDCAKSIKISDWRDSATCVFNTDLPEDFDLSQLRNYQVVDAHDGFSTEVLIDGKNTKVAFFVGTGSASALLTSPQSLTIEKVKPALLAAVEKFTKRRPVVYTQAY